jgi:chromatin segregation and condensation protein Rec8/ScpA/Scc1 (kleisin family)
MPDAIESELRLFGNPPESQRQRGLVSVEEPDRPLKARAAVASTLLAGLEPARDAQASMEQQEAFGHILLPATLQDASVGS